MTDNTGSAATYEDKSEGEQTGASYVKMWLDALGLADDEEKDWRKKAEETCDVYRTKRSPKQGRSFNILHSNVETICPALYNSTPQPDVRRRFADADPIGKAVADMLERALSFSIDNYDFDALMKAVIKDGEIVGRGVPRVRYVPTFGQDGQVAYEEVVCDYVPWRYFRRGPGRAWKDVPWLAYGDFLSRDELRKLCGELTDKNGKPVAEEVPLNYDSAQNKDGGRGRKAGAQEQSIFSRALVWQIWDRDNRRIVSICPDYNDAPLSVVDDPLGLTDFYPTPRPYQPILSTDSLAPVVPYEVYEDLVDELNDITARISKLVRQLRPRGGYGGQVNDIKAMSEADDGELVPLTNVEQLVSEGGIEKAITWFPLEPTIKALAQLVQQREQVKQTIYEVTGIADILRGSTQASETATAQQIKAQWGSLRIQDRQGEVARLARDLLRIKAEIIASKFSWDTLVQMTGINPLTQEQQAMLAQQGGQPAPELDEETAKKLKQPTKEEIEAVLRSDSTRAFRVDIESDSTIRGDLARNQEVMNTFLAGTAQFAQAMGPLVMQIPQLMAPALEVYTAFSRQFKLGKQAEDALDSLAGMAREMKDVHNQPPPPDPKIEIEGKKLELEAKKHQDTIELEGKKLEATAALKREEAAGTVQLKREEMAGTADLKREEMIRTADLKREEMAGNAQLKREEMAGTADLKRDEIGRNHEMKREEMAHSSKIEMQKHTDATAMQERHHSDGMAVKREDIAHRQKEGEAGREFERAKHGLPKAEELKAFLDDHARSAQGIQKMLEGVLQHADTANKKIEGLAADLAAPVEFLRDPKTGKAIGARKGQRTITLVHGADGKLAGMK